jgi:hypothetical protein
MKQITPFQTFKEAIESFDNGGIFFDFLSHVHERIVPPAERGKVPGSTLAHQAMTLYLTMSISRMDSHAGVNVIAHLDPTLIDFYGNIGRIRSNQQGFLGSSIVPRGGLRSSLPLKA